MKLKKIKLKNFRGYSVETSFEVSDLNVIIGKNDIGKSTILEALDVFFIGKPEKEDLCIDNDDNAIEITCIFADVPEEFVLDDTVSTRFSEEFLLNSQNFFIQPRKFKALNFISRRDSVSDVVSEISF